MRLALGSGNMTAAYNISEYITVDAVKRNGKPDYLIVIPPLPDEILKMGPAFEIVEAMHFWEHLHHWQAVELAEQVATILRPDGRFILEMPNIQKAINYMAGVEQAPDINDPRFTMWALYGPQTDPNWMDDEWQTHKWGYTPETITKQLKGAGFRNVEIKQAQERLPIVRDMRVVAYV